MWNSNNSGYGPSPYGGGFGWTSDTGRYTGYGYGSNPYSEWGYRQDYKPW